MTARSDLRPDCTEAVYNRCSGSLAEHAGAQTRASALRFGVAHYFRNFRQTGGILNPVSTLHQRHRWLGLIHESEVNP